MRDGYHHTQIGWLSIGISLGVAVFLGVLFLRSELAPVAPFLIGLLVLVAATFGALTIDVGAGVLTARFGITPLRRRIDLAEVVAVGAVRNRWYYGWGIRWVPTGWLWNTGGLQAIELRLRNGKAFRLGTDEPEALVAAIRAAAPGVGPLTEAQRAQGERGARTAAFIVTAVVLLAALLIGGIFYATTRPLAVVVDGQALRIEAPLYSVDVPLREVRDVRLQNTLPRILSRTNGSAWNGQLRGHFRLEAMGAGRLYVDLGHPPYLVVETADRFVILNFAEAARTRQLYAELSALR